MNDTQRNAYQLTINNPQQHGYDHTEIKKILVTEFTTLRFFAMCDEIGNDQNTYHTHVYAFFSSRVRFSKLKKAFPEAHIEIARGTANSNVEYIKKTGKWENTDKSETSVAGTYEEWGDMPIQKGRKPEMEELYQMVKSGYTDAEILSYNNDYIMLISTISNLRTTLMREKYKRERRTDLKVIYVSGTTGSGKTRTVLDLHGDENVYRVSDYAHPFDFYTLESVLVFDEFRSQLSISDMLQYLDIYPIVLPARYANKFLCATTIYIISNWRLEQQFYNSQIADKESWRAFLRRIHEVHIYKENGMIERYDSVEKYLKRNEQFESVAKENLPFTDL